MVPSESMGVVAGSGGMAAAKVKFGKELGKWHVWIVFLGKV